MRTIFSSLIFFSLSALAADMDLFESRGLKNGQCYRENAKYECTADCKTCTLHLFPGIKAQLSFPATGLADFCNHFKTDTGLATFKFKNKKEVVSADVFGFIQVKKDLSEAWSGKSLKTNSTPCPRE